VTITNKKSKNTKSNNYKSVSVIQKIKKQLRLILNKLKLQGKGERKKDKTKKIKRKEKDKSLV